MNNNKNDGIRKRKNNGKHKKFEQNRDKNFNTVYVFDSFIQTVG